jgi:hypothetical protein
MREHNDEYFLNLTSSFLKMALVEYSGAGKRKPRKRATTTVRRTVKKRVVRKPVKRRVSTVRRHEGGRSVAVRKVVRKVHRSASVLKSKTDDTRKYRRVKGKPRGDIHGAKFVGKRIKEESAKKGRKLTRTELSKLFKDAWAEYKLRKGK